VVLTVVGSETIHGPGTVKGGDAGAALGQRCPAVEVAVGDELEGAARAKADHGADRLVPPAIGGDLGGVAVEDAGLRVRGRRGHPAAIRLDLVALPVDEAAHERHLARRQRPLQGGGAEAVEMQDDEPLSHQG